MTSAVVRRLAEGGLVALLSTSCASLDAGSAGAKTAVAVRAEKRSRLVASAFPGDEQSGTTCRHVVEEQGFVDCLLDARFRDDRDTYALVRRLYTEHGVVAGIEPVGVMDDGDYRGRVDLEPASPVGDKRIHLELILDAFSLLDTVFAEFARRAPAPMRFVRKPNVIRFFETKTTTTPSAYAADGAIAYNLRGELWTSPESVFETLVHELFHLSDADRGYWSIATLKEHHDAIRARCGSDQSCLDRFAPHETKVDGGIYYAFHPTSDVREYAAELAARYVREQRERLLSSDVVNTTPFKCQAVENEKVWRELAEEFFGGLDLTPPC